jgi:zona occludens toxin
MITLITGTPGSGKSLYAVWMLRKELKAGRRLLVNGIAGLALDHELLDDDAVRDWPSRVQPRDILVVDEVQRIWPPVAQGSKVSADVEALHIHRHKGIDVVVITQHPNRMNKTVRDLVGRHVHVRRLFGWRRAMLYEWDSARNPNNGFRDAVQTSWRYPKSVYQLYVSAEVHTKPKAVIPNAVYWGPLAVLAAVFFGWRGFKHFAPGAHEDKAGSPVAASGLAASPGAAALVSKSWRVVGRYVIDGRAFVLLADKSGRLRSAVAKQFDGDELHVDGSLDGERVTVWSGALSTGSSQSSSAAAEVAR